MLLNILERFESKYIPEPNSGCWLWLGSKTLTGYGYFRVGNKMKRAHRVSFELFKGNIPGNLYVLHACDNPSCVNPNHLSLGTQKDNMRDMIGKGRLYPSEKHPKVKLTTDQVIEIRKLYSLGKASMRDLAHSYSMSYKAINSLLTFKTWKSI